MAKNIVMYGTTWCGDTRRARKFFDDNKVEYQWIDIETDKAGKEYVLKANNGNEVIPTIVFKDGSILTEPSNAELADKVGI